MANNGVDVLPRQPQAGIVAAPTDFLELFADEGTGLLGSVDESEVVTIYGLATVDESNIIYFGKHGNDANNGKSNGKAKLTIAAAVAAAVAETPSSTNVFSIRGEDAGIYTENIDMPAWVNLDAPSATIVGNVTAEGNTATIIQRINVATGTGFLKNTDSDHCLVQINRIQATGTAIAADIVSGTMMVDIQMITHVNGGGICNTAAVASDVRGFVNHISATGTGDAIAVSGDTGNKMSLVMADIRDNGSGVGFNIDVGELNITIAHFNPTTGGDIAAGAELNMLVSELNGKTFTGSGTQNITEAGVEGLPVDDTTSIVQDPVDNTKQMRIDVGLVTTGTTRVATMPDKDITLGEGNPTLSIWTPATNEPPSANPATFVVRGGHLLLAFDDTTDESAIFKGIMPQSYSDVAVDVIVRFVMATATTGDVDIDAAFERLDTGGADIDIDNFASPQSVLGTTVPGTSGVIGAVTIPFTAGAQMDSVTAGDGFRIRIRSLSAGTAVGDLQLVDLELREQ